MKTVGLITEYNPFHNGHLYHIERARELTGADRVVIVMSGDYVQRGTPALLSKHSRAHIALLNGYLRASCLLCIRQCRILRPRRHLYSGRSGMHRYIMLWK